MKKKDNLEEFNISPYYKGLLFSERAPGTSSEAESTNPITHDFQNSYLPSPYYKGLLYTEKVAGKGTTLEAESTNPTVQDFQNSYLPSPYYKGLLYTKKVTGTGTTVEAESTTGGIIPHELMININSYSPYYKGLLNQDTTPDRESVAATFAGSSSGASFSLRGYIRKTFSLKEMKEDTMQLKDECGGTKNNLMIEDLGSKGLDLEPELDFGPIQHPIEPSHEDRPIKFPMPHSFYLITEEQTEEYQFLDRKITEPQVLLHKEDDALKAIESPVIMIRMRHHDHTNAIVPVLQTSPVQAHMHQTDR
ncbi:hypothetical protein SSX86_007053 [Deinandra increscens subsp. villosa]|uniref:Uncharacterized protein n=1 Tax=Deinandra increscens subsp. villosa TaxID=3103831 RepID=A0AAP0DFZ8_9ASTR